MLEKILDWLFHYEPRDEFIKNYREYFLGGIDGKNDRRNTDKG